MGRGVVAGRRLVKGVGAMHRVSLTGLVGSRAAHETRRGARTVLGAVAAQDPVVASALAGRPHCSLPACSVMNGDCTKSFSQSATGPLPRVAANPGGSPRVGDG